MTDSAENLKNPAGLVWNEADILRAGKWLFVFLILAALALCYFHIRFTWFPDPGRPHRLVHFFHLDREGNLPTWFSSTLFLLLAVILFALYVLERHRPTGKFTAKLWLLCMAGAIFLSLDEAAGFHELLGTYLGLLSKQAEVGSWFNNIQYFPSYYWVLIYVPLLVPAAIVVLWLLYQEMRRELFLVLAGVAIYLTGAVVLDHLEGRYGFVNQQGVHEGIYFHAFNMALWVDAALLEEFMEMLGISVTIYAFIRHFAKRYGQHFPANA